MDDDKKDYCGFDDGQDWLDDLAIEDYQLNKKGADDDKKSKSNDFGRSNGRRNL